MVQELPKRCEQSALVKILKNCVAPGCAVKNACISTYHENQPPSEVVKGNEILINTLPNVAFGSK
jgi:hypothetical protein